MTRNLKLFGALVLAGGLMAAFSDSGSSALAAIDSEVSISISADAAKTAVALAQATGDTTQTIRPRIMAAQAITIAQTEEAVTIASAPADGLVTTGSWTKKKRVSKGTWSIVREDGGLFVELDADFRTRGAPDLKLFLSPFSAAEVNKNNALEGAHLISLLDSNKGAQRYVIPDIENLDGYRSIIIHCEDYTVLWSAADL